MTRLAALARPAGSPCPAGAPCLVGPRIATLVWCAVLGLLCATSSTAAVSSSSTLAERLAGAGAATAPPLWSATTIVDYPAPDLQPVATVLASIGARLRVLDNAETALKGNALMRLLAQDRVNGAFRRMALVASAYPVHTRILNEEGRVVAEAVIRKSPQRVEALLREALRKSDNLDLWADALARYSTLAREGLDLLTRERRHLESARLANAPKTPPASGTPNAATLDAVTLDAATSAEAVNTAESFSSNASASLAPASASTPTPAPAAPSPSRSDAQLESDALGEALAVLSRKIEALDLYSAQLRTYDEGWPDPQTTLSAMDRALTLDPGNVMFSVARAEALTRLDRVYEALDTLNEAAKDEHFPARGHAARGMAQLRLHMPTLAIHDFTRALTLRDDKAAWWHARGAAKLLAGELDTLCQDLEKACSLGDCQGLANVRTRKLCQ